MAFGDSILRPNIRENWLFKFANRQSGYLYVAMADVVFTNFYHGVVLNKPTIRESIDLAKSTAKTSNMSVVIQDFDYNGSPVSKELFGGTNNYINHNVTVYSKIDGDTPNQIGSFRLENVTTDGSKITLSLTSHRPWDYLSYEKKVGTAGSKITEPISYGNFTGNTKTGYYFTDLTSYALRPLPRVPSSVGYSNGVESISSYTYLPEVWDYEAGVFFPITESTNGNTTSSLSTNIVTPDVLYRREVKFRGDSSSGTWEDQAKAYNTNTTDYAFKSWDTSSETNAIMVIYFPNELIGEATGNGSVTFTWENACTAGGESVNLVKLWYGINASSANDMNVAVQTSVVGQTHTGSVTASFANPHGGYIGFKSSTEIDSGTVEGYSRIKDVTLTYTIKQDPATVGNFPIKLYSGEDGLAHGISDSNYTGAIADIHEAHLDVLNRFCGIDSSNVANDVEGWDDGTASDLASDRNGWNIRWWSLEEFNIKDVLEQMQYEGCFIFRFKQGDFTKPQYIHIKNSPTANVTLTKEDISSINISTTPFSDIITKREIKYAKTPIDDDTYYSEGTAVVTSGTTPRTKWNIQTKENIEEIKLDMLATKVVNTDSDGDVGDDNPNDNFASYYHNIFGDIKLIVSCDVVNPAKWVDSSKNPIEVGSVVEFDNNNMHPKTPMGYNSGSWSNLKFMITDCQRSLGKLKIQVRSI